MIQGMVIASTTAPLYKKKTLPFGEREKNRSERSHSFFFVAFCLSYYRYFTVNLHSKHQPPQICRPNAYRCEAEPHSLIAVAAAT